MSAEDFPDTNVFVYLFDETAPDKRQRAERLVRRSLDGGSGCISTQVVQETLNVVTRKLGARPASARLLLDDVLAPLWRVNPSRSLYARGLQTARAVRLQLLRFPDRGSRVGSRLCAALQRGPAARPAAWTR